MYRFVRILLVGFEDCLHQDNNDSHKTPFGKVQQIRESNQASGVRKAHTRCTMFGKAPFCLPELA